jgi:hypothetical protein
MVEHAVVSTVVLAEPLHGTDRAIGLYPRVANLPLVDYDFDLVIVCKIREELGSVGADT